MWERRASLEKTLSLVMSPAEHLKVQMVGSLAAGRCGIVVCSVGYGHEDVKPVWGCSHGITVVNECS